MRDLVYRFMNSAHLEEVQNKRVYFVDVYDHILRLSYKIMKVIVYLAIFIVVYLGASIYFSAHFYFGTVINGINVSGKTSE